MDTDHDEKLMPGEFQVYVDGQNAAAALRVRLQVIDRGQDLFSVLDANGDGLLTPRELRAAPGLVDAEDRDGDGSLGGSEIPVRWSLDISRGSPLAAQTAPNARRLRAPQLTPADFAAPDADHDGLIDAQEAASAAPR
jgi:hypothetical protein